MKSFSKTIKNFLSDASLLFEGIEIESKYVDEEPLRAELFSFDQMKQHSLALAKSHKLSKKRVPDQLLLRLADNEKILLAVRNLLAKSVKLDFEMSPAGEWLLDNFYLIEEQIRLAKKHLPRGYSEGLPQLSEGNSKGLPRVYDIVLELISHSDGKIDLENVSDFLSSYSEVTHLHIGELWAIPIMLRLALIENIRRVSTRIAVERTHRNLADSWAKQLIATVENEPKDLILVLADMARSNPPLERAFVAEFTRQLRGKGPTLAQALTWVEQRLAENGQTSEELVHAENQKQAADQVSVSNTIGSLRLLSAVDWRAFVETHSVVEKILSEDLIYPLMDFSTRDHYRHVLESVAKKSLLTEEEVAKLVLQLARESAEMEPNSRTAHVGFYLIGKGLPHLEKQANKRIPIIAKIRKRSGRMPLFMYLGSIGLITAAITSGIVLQVSADILNYPLLALVAFLSVIFTSQLAVTVVNFLSSLIVKPSLLPRMDYSTKIPEESRTMVIVPSMLNNEDAIEILVEALEVRYLANKGMNLHFGLLTDFIDASEKEMPRDKELLQFVQEKIVRLNQKYIHERLDIFYLFHRPRVWNEREGKWMGYERKRGKLAELNALLRGKVKNGFALIIGEQSVLSQIKYVITLDADTQLPREAAWKMIGAISHPLNHALYDEKKKRVVEGYGILQPRVGVSLPDVCSSYYVRMNGSQSGIDPYTRAVSDIYQDIFEEGSFIGKGIYDVDVFEKALDEKFPENRILSHDLLEGCYVRSGLLSDVQLYEKYPARYLADMQRRHRWIRGDWQIAAWVLPFVPGADFSWHLNPVSLLSRWKIFDNIRRSLVAIALTVFIILAWAVLPCAGWWTLIITAIIIIPSLFSPLWNLFLKPKDVIFRHHIILTGHAVGNTAVELFFYLICLPYEAFITLNAILKTTWRMIISRRHLLEWQPTGTGEFKKKANLYASYLTMWSEPVLALAVFAGLYFTAPSAIAAASPILLLWLVSPIITWRVSQPIPKEKSLLSLQQSTFLQKTARQTWSFFERFVTADDNWLPPDNFQQDPDPVIAHRTSPTNIGLYLLSNLSAYDFGYLTAAGLIERTDNTFNTLHKMEKYQGHFYNWYDTQSLHPLHPRYISTVDSGNLAGLLLTLKQGILALPNQKIIGDKLFAGLSDTLAVFKDTLVETDINILLSFKTELKQILNELPKTLYEFKQRLDVLQSKLNEISFENTERNEEANWWLDALHLQLQAAITELTTFAPWVLLSTVPEKLNRISQIIGIPTLQQLSELTEAFSEEISKIDSTDEDAEWFKLFENAIQNGVEHAKERLAVIEKLAENCNRFSQMELDFLYDKTKSLLTIGFNVEDHRCDPSFYDLLASEARLGIFVGIAQGRLPQESWFALGRLLTNVDRHPILLSWSGSMFEYLMPLLVMPTYPNTLLDQTDKEAVSIQIEYGKQRKVPWGISECGYNLRDAAQNYQYRAFGVPGLGLKRGLGEDLVIAPYATMLALMVNPVKACQNLEQMASLGFVGKYGFFEAIDYTQSRLRPGQSHTIVQSYMAHHQGMSFLSLAHLLLNQPMQKRFEAEPQFQAALLLLQERIPKTSSFYVHTTDIVEVHTTTTEPSVRILRTPNTTVPAVQLLSNGRYHVMITNAGGGYSLWKNLAVTRWREDATCDNRGTFCYIRDTEKGNFWSTAHQPTLVLGKNFEVAFSQGRADIHILQNNIVSHTEIVVSPEDDIEMRRVHITNRGSKRRLIDVTTYAEVVIAPPADDDVHPAFGNLFVQTEILEQQHAILCSRRPRSHEEKTPWMFHMVKVHEKDVAPISFETDRLQFLGRGNTVFSPKAMNTAGPLLGSHGAVLDPIVSIRVPISLEPDETITLDVITGMGDTREICKNLVDKYQDKHHKDRVFELAWTHNQIVTRQINATEAEAQLYTRLAASILFSNPALRAEPTVLIRNHRGQAGLWPYSISGDLPIVLLKIEDESDIDLVKQMVQAHTYWRLKGLLVDLVIWNENHGGYRQLLQNQITELLSTQATNQPGGIFIRAAEQISEEDSVLFQTVARAIISSTGGSLADHIHRKVPTKAVMPLLVPSKEYSPSPMPLASPQNLTFFNGLGGFSADGREYVIYIADKNMTPAPWANVIANANFGTVISESGQSYTWSENAHEFRLSPWNNDTVCDSAGETFYLRDEETGQYWSPTVLTTGGQPGYLARHGFGYSVFEHNEDGIHSEMTVFVDLEHSIKFSVIKLKNVSGRARKISVTGYVELVLGDLRPKSALYIGTEFDMEFGAIFAKNPYNTEFPDRVAFFDVDETNKTYTGDRAEFIGRNGNLQNPEAMLHTKLSGKTGLGMDPCAAIQVAVDLFDGQEREIIFRLGAGKNAEEARNTLRHFRDGTRAKDTLEKVKAYWQNTVTAMQVETPDAATNVLTNGWLIYQTLSCRLWGRSGYYQSGGAFGFRDQLQDVMALMQSAPELARKQILLSASRQFIEGDVQHWWHVPSGRGVRTRCSDDYLWLPFVTCQYLTTTGNTAILDEMIPFLQGRPLNPGEESYYELTTHTHQMQQLYFHCVKAIENGLHFGANGLPLIGTGDWNDGMDRVGQDGKGESVWLAFFLYDILVKFAEVARQRNDLAFANRCVEEALKLKANIDKNAWDGEWYLRAFFDDGTPLGSNTNEECKIDSLAQSWSKLSGAGDEAKSNQAMESAYTHLVKKEEALIRLLTPAFDKSDLNPGYIKGYVPGVRENGGQYTHAAVWLVMAFAKAGNSKRAWELLQLINPVNHGRTAEEIAVYKVEPYVTAGDVYSVVPHTGRGGWTWYTGSSGWMYRLITEYFLGVSRTGNLLHIKPCIPQEWHGYKVHYRFGKTMYHITVIQNNGAGEISVMLDNVIQLDGSINLLDDGVEHQVEVKVFERI